MREPRQRPAGDVDYSVHGEHYSSHRRADPAIAAQVHEALGDARKILNVGAGAGSYEPSDREVVAVEPSAAMRARRPAHLTPAIDAVAEDLPFDDDAFDASMALATVHQWTDLGRGLAEMRRVTRGPVVVMAFDPSSTDGYWLAQYAPELMDVIRRRDPPLAAIREALGGTSEVRRVAIPRDCQDGFSDAYYARPEAFLDPSVRRAQSSWAFLAPGVEEAIVERLREALASGEWDRSHGFLRALERWDDSSLRLVIARRE